MWLAEWLVEWNADHDACALVGTRLDDGLIAFAVEHAQPFADIA